jgi:hypothetical protein
MSNYYLFSKGWISGLGGVAFDCATAGIRQKEKH